MVHCKCVVIRKPALFPLCLCVCKPGIRFCVQVELALHEFIKFRAATDHCDQYTTSIYPWTACIQCICANVEVSLKDKWIQGRRRAKCTLWICSGVYAHVRTPALCSCSLCNLYPLRSTSSERLQSGEIKWASGSVWALGNPVTTYPKTGIISSSFKASLNHTSCDQLWGILLAASQTENYTSQIDNRRDWDEE